jgi:transposase
MKEKNAKAFPIIYPNAAGIDIASKEHYVAVNPNVNPNPIRVFGSFTEDLRQLAIWLKECKVDTVAMEATGIYWVSLFLVLEQEGFDVVLVTAKHVKNVRGKKQTLVTQNGSGSFIVVDCCQRAFSRMSLPVNCELLCDTGKIC